MINIGEFFKTMFIAGFLALLNCVFWYKIVNLENSILMFATSFLIGAITAIVRMDKVLDD